MKQAAKSIVINRDSVGEIEHWFGNVYPPYGRQEIEQFNSIYRRLYDQLSRDEKQRAEQIVDTLIADLVDPALAPSLFGVV